MDVPVGSYKITFSPAANSQWVWEYYNDVRDYSAATTLTVAEGATVKLWKFKKNGDKVLVGEDVINAKGKRKFFVSDNNGKKFTKYVAKVLGSDDTEKANTNKRAVR